MRDAQRGWCVAASIALILSWFCPTPALALRNAQPEQQPAVSAGLTTALSPASRAGAEETWDVKVHYQEILTGPSGSKGDLGSIYYEMITLTPADESTKRLAQALGLDLAKPLYLVRETETMAQMKGVNHPFFAATDGALAVRLQVDAPADRLWVRFLDRFSRSRPGKSLLGPASLAAVPAEVRIIATEPFSYGDDLLRVTVARAPAAGLEEDRLVAQARAAVEHMAVVDELRQQTVQVWNTARPKIPSAPAGATGPTSAVLIFTGSSDMWDLAVLAVEQGRDVVVQVEQSAAVKRIAPLFAALFPSDSHWVVGRGWRAVGREMLRRGWADRPRREISTRSDAFNVLGLREEALLPGVRSALTRTHDYFKAQQAGLETGA